MGTSAAVMWATIYYVYHKVHTLLTKHGTNLLYYKRSIDNVFCVWTGNLTTDWAASKEDVNNFGVLKWEIESVTPSSSVNFLDMTLTICNNKIITKTYQKEINLHLYIPPSSKHPPNCTKRYSIQSSTNVLQTEHLPTRLYLLRGPPVPSPHLTMHGQDSHQRTHPPSNYLSRK